MSGSFVVEIILLLAALFVGFLVPLLGLLIFLFTLGYSLYRTASKKKVCERCGHPGLIPVDTPLGKKLVKEVNTPEAGLQGKE